MLKTNALQKSITKICGFHVFCLWRQQNYQCFSRVSDEKLLKAAMLFETNIQLGFLNIDKFNSLLVACNRKNTYLCGRNMCGFTKNSHIILWR